jgi:hypothetical protein
LSGQPLGSHTLTVPPICFSLGTCGTGVGGTGVAVTTFSTAFSTTFVCSTTTVFSTTFSFSTTTVSLTTFSMTCGVAGAHADNTIATIVNNANNGR